jgi:hypothetical protein
MKRKSRNLPWFLLVFITVGGTFFFLARPQLPGSQAAEGPQNLIRLESRMSQLEQRFYAIEINLRGLEQQVRLSSNAQAPAARDARDPQLLLLQTELETLRQRVEEVSCGLLRVDERTLTPAAREARKKAAADGAESCRANVDSPVRFSLTR